jgi:hypothetical protein
LDGKMGKLTAEDREDKSVLTSLCLCG